MPNKYLARMLILLILFELGLSAVGQPKAYPDIRPASISVEISRSKPEIAKTLIITDSLGKPAYELSITAISADNQTTKAIYLSLSTAGRYSPSPDEKYEPNLLKSDYWGHGEGPEVIHPEELCQANANNPTYGVHREFNLRRMKITVDVTDFSFSDNFCPQTKCGLQKGGLDKAKVTVDVQPGDSKRKRPVNKPYNTEPCDKSE